MKRLFQFIAVLIVLAGAWFGYSVFSPVTPASSDPGYTILFKTGASTRQIALKLESEGVVHSAHAFLLWHILHGRRTLKAGEYQFQGSEALPSVYDKLARGEVFAHAVVVPEGFNMFDIATALQAAGLCKREDFLRAAREQTHLVQDLDPQARSLEGYLFPDTYEFSRTQTAQEMAAAMVRRFRQEAASAGLAAPQFDVHRVVTLASIVEKETAVAAERPLVAGVFENRLTHHIGLATDPSVIYASLLAGKFDGVIHQSDLALDSPYNTYKFAGLPPGPISNPGKEAIYAAMHPQQTDYLYFVANNQGGHNFARTIEEHNRNVALYRKQQQ